jgi:hypothetical protein
VFLIMFKTGQALLLPGGRFSGPRHGREAGAEQPRTVTGSWPQTRHFREIELVQYRTQPRVGHVREQSVIAFNPRHQSHPRTVRVHAQATASIVREQAAAAVVNRPQTIRSRKQSSAANWSQTQFVRDREPAMSDPRRSIGVSAWVSANFPVFIQIISLYEHV